MKYIKLIVLMFFICLTVSLMGCQNIKIENNRGVIINEICTNNGSSLATKDYKYVDWIELYNTTDKDIYLKEFGLSDDSTNYYKYRLPEVYIKAKEYLIVFFDNGNSTEQLFANFGLSDKGETIYFTMPNGTVIDTVNVPPLKLDSTYGRYENNRFEITNPTPYEINTSKPLYKHIENPEFSFDGGFYDEEFYLELSAKENVKIYYTLDSSVPDENSNLYVEPIRVIDPSMDPNILKSRDDMSIFENTGVDKPVDKMFVVRAIAISEDGNKSQIVTQNYFINKNKYKANKIVSLVTDIDNLTNPETGILIKGKAYEDYVAGGSQGDAPNYNWDLEGRVSERNCNLTYINNGNFTINQNCGMRIHGYGGRSIFYKSFNIYARSNYGDKYFMDPIFENAKRTKSFILKYDRYSPSSERFKDGFIQSLVADRSVTIQEYEQCILFINGEYWNTYSIMQKYTDDFIEDEYNIDKDNVIIVKDGVLEAGSDSDFTYYQNLINYIKNTDLSIPENYNKFCDMVDVQSLIDFYTVQLYTNNFDFSYRKNYVLWRTRSDNGSGYSDGKWRYMLYDLDYVAVNVSLEYKGDKAEYNYKFNTFTGIFLYATDFRNDIFFNKLMKNDEFKELFATSFLDIANHNLSSENVNKKAKEEYNYTHGTMKTFFTNRMGYVKGYLADYLGVSADYATLQINTAKNIEFNTLNLNENFTGEYLKCYPLVLKNVNIDNLLLKDLSIISNQNGKITLMITGNNPTITYN